MEHTSDSLSMQETLIKVHGLAALCLQGLEALSSVDCISEDEASCGYERSVMLGGVCTALEVLYDMVDKEVSKL